jgi:hypothetical protein
MYGILICMYGWIILILICMYECLISCNFLLDWETIVTRSGSFGGCCSLPGLGGWKSSRSSPHTVKIESMNQFDRNHVVIGNNSCGYHRLLQYFLNITIVSMTFVAFNYKFTTCIK